MLGLRFERPVVRPSFLYLNLLLFELGNLVRSWLLGLFSVFTSWLPMLELDATMMLQFAVIIIATK